MATAPKSLSLQGETQRAGVGAPICPQGQNTASSVSPNPLAPDHSEPAQRDALQALLALSALHKQVCRRKAVAQRQNESDASVPMAEVEQGKQFDLEEVLQIVAYRAMAITGADGVAIALAGNNEIVSRAAAGELRPDLRLQSALLVPKSTPK